MFHEIRNSWFLWIDNQILAFEESRVAGSQWKFWKNWNVICEKIIQSFRDFKIYHFGGLNEMVRYISCNLSGEERIGI